MFGKCSEAYTQRFTEIEMRDLERAARESERSVSEFVRLTMRQYLYGSGGRTTPQVEKSRRGYETHKTGGVGE